MAEHTPNPGSTNEVLAKEAGARKILAKEVLAPQSPYSGLGVVLVAALAMFMAMASSAFVLRARMARHARPSPGAHYQSQLPAAEQWHTLERVSAGECGKPQYHTNPDGSVSVRFETCADNLDMDGLRQIHDQSRRQSQHPSQQKIQQAPASIDIRRAR